MAINGRPQTALLLQSKAYSLKSRTRIANLRNLGVSRDQAVTHGMSSKGAWVMSSSQAVHEALSIAYLTQTGLASLLTIWQKLSARK